MKEVFQGGLTLFVVLPYLLTVLVFVVSKAIGRPSVQSFRLAADSTVPLLVIASTILLSMYFEEAMVMLLVSILASGIIYTVLERIRSKEFRTKYMFRNLWRMMFIMFSLFYIILLIIGTARSVTQFLSKDLASVFF